MKELNNRRLSVLTVGVVVLIVAVAVQSVVIFGLHKRMDRAPSDEAGTPLAVIQEEEGDPLRLSPRRPPVPFGDDPFDWPAGDWDPFKEMHSMHDRINQMFGSAFNRFQDSGDFGPLFHGYSFSPDINIQDKGDHYLVTVDLPGAEDSQLAVTVDGQTLTISGSVQTESKAEEGGKMLRQERRSGRFQRVVTLPGPVKADAIKSKHVQGVLHIEIPKEDR